MDEFITFDTDWLQAFEDSGHEIIVNFAIPAVMAVLSAYTWVFNIEINLESVQKGAKQKITVNFKLNFIWKLIKNYLVIGVHDCKILVILPFVVKEILDLVFLPGFHLYLFVELIDQAKEP